MGSDLSVRILYILPTINTISLTAARDTKLTGKVQELFPEVSPGLVVRDATVHYGTMQGVRGALTLITLVLHLITGPNFQNI